MSFLDKLPFVKSKDAPLEEEMNEADREFFRNLDDEVAKKVNSSDEDTEEEQGEVEDNSETAAYETFSEEEEKPKKKNLLAELLSKFKRKKKPPQKVATQVTVAKTGNLPAKRKFAQAGEFVVLVGVLGIFGYAASLMFGDDATNSNLKSAVVKPIPLREEYVLQADILTVNPFVKIKNFDDFQNPTWHAGTSGLPAIPQGATPPPSVGSIPKPSIPDKPIAAAKEPSAKVTVTGIVIGKDGGNIAILSDGTVVTEGETYKDGRIAYIGGDGIHFDDGETMEY